MNRKRVIAYLLLATVSILVTAQQGTAATFKIKLSVTLDGPGGDVFRSALAREFRKLDGVEVVDDAVPENELRVVAVPMTSGFAASVLLTSKADVESPLYFSENKDCYPTEKEVAASAEMFKDYVVIEDVWVFIGSDVASLATRIAAAVDVNDVELHRQTQRRLEDLLRKRAEQKHRQ